MDIFIDFANFLIEAIGGGLAWVINLLPESPAKSFTNTTPDSINLGYVTWFIPFHIMALHFALLLSCIGIYYAYRIVARWLKVVRG